MKEKGFVKWYNYEKGYGFTDDNIFIHFTELKDGVFTRLYEGDCIEFISVVIGKDRLKATDIRLI